MSWVTDRSPVPRAAWCLLAAGLFAGACGDDAPGGATSAPEEPRICTEIGCQSGVSFDLGELPSSARRATVCVDSRCRTFERVREQPPTVVFVALADVRAKRQVRAVLRVPARRGRGRIVAELPVTLRGTRPNGPGCPPVCFQASVRYDAGGRRLEER